MFDNGAVAELPTERLETEICTLAGHLAAATCQWLLLVGEFDAREGWRAWEQLSCAGWLSWKCGMSLTTAHERVRVARALTTLPVTREAFAAGTLSYSKVRAISRLATADDEDGWVACALGCTAAQLDRLSLACRRIGRARSESRASHEKLSWRHDDDGMLVICARLAPEHGARVVAALEQLQRAAADTAPDDPGARSSAEDTGALPTAKHPRLGCSLPEALVAMADQVLAHGQRPVNAGDLHQIVTHADEGALSGTGGRCEYPGCPRKAWLQVHHVIHWVDGGPTSYANLCLLCSRHHRAHHAGTFQITHDPRLRGHFRFRLADGTDVDDVPPLPPPTGDIAARHGARITADTIQPAWCGDPLNLDYAALVMGQLAGPYDRTGVCTQGVDCGP